MSLYITGGVAMAYAVGVVGVHRYAVHRRRAQAGFYPTLNWLDWDTLLEGVIPRTKAAGDAAEGPRPPEGGPPPRALSRQPEEGQRAQHELLRALVSGTSVDPDAFEQAGFSGGEAGWLGSLATLRSAPVPLLRKLEEVAPHSPAEAYLREVLVLQHDATPVNLELVSFSSKQRIAHALGQFGEHPALFFVRARASSLLGFNAAVLDDLARAVYFSREAPFYVRAVIDHPWVAEARPALSRACRAALERAGMAGHVGAGVTPAGSP